MRRLQQPVHVGTQITMFGEAFNPRFLMADEANEFDDIDGAPWDDTNLAPENETFDNLKMEMERAFGGELSDETEDEDDDDPGVLFSYKEKCFEEDDISDLGSNIVITIPDEMRERKCNACRQRFMLKESYEQHAKECIELKLSKFINEGYQLLQMRQSRTLSANEFVRRMIYALKKVMKSLSMCYKDASDQPLSMGVDDKLTKKLNLFDLADDTSKQKKAMNNYISHLTPLSSISAPIVPVEQQRQNEQQNKYLLDLLEGKPNVSIQKNHFAEHKVATSPTTTIAPRRLNTSHSSWLHSKIQTQESLFEQCDTSHLPKMQSSGIPDASQPAGEAATKRIEKPTFSTESQAIAAQCSQCSASFSSIAAFEEHIRYNHNIRSMPVRSPPTVVSEI